MFKAPKRSNPESTESETGEKPAAAQKKQKTIDNKKRHLLSFEQEDEEEDWTESESIVDILNELFWWVLILPLIFILNYFSQMVSWLSIFKKNRLLSSSFNHSEVVALLV